MEHLRKLDPAAAGMSVEGLKQDILDKLLYTQAKFPEIATDLDRYLAVAHAIRDRLLQRWITTAETYMRQNVRVVCYFSAEYLLGPQLGNNLLNLGISGETKEACESLGYDFATIVNQEPEPGLGNGGLGRLAACYVDSLATLQVPAIGYGIRYEYGIFSQQIRDGWQVECTDKWLQYGNPWEIARPEIAVDIGLGGKTESYFDRNGRYCVRWLPGHMVRALPHDTPVLGYLTNTTNTLRLWSAEAVESFDFEAFNHSDYMGAVRQKMQSETISKVLYPNDESLQGKQLRLAQQFFFVSASLQDMIRIHLYQKRHLEDFDRKWAVQMNDTHPSIAVAELMRLLVDEHGMDWDPAWKITQNTFGYTNHTLLPEALEKWPLSLFKALLPRHLEIIFEINQRFLDAVRAKYPGDNDRLRRVSLIDEEGARYVRMAHLAAVGSHAINGVAELHTDLLEKDVLRDIHELFPGKFSNKTNGVTPRRWMALSDCGLASLITKALGAGWLTDLSELKGLVPLAEDPAFRKEWEAAQCEKKIELAAYIRSTLKMDVDPNSMFDVMVKRIHEYKRQHLNVLHILTLYNRIKKNPSIAMPSRTFLFGGKAAPGYFMAKLIIKLINSVAEFVNGDPQMAGRLKVVFLPNYNVTLAQRVYPAADLSEQISLAGKEASGTGNMKSMMNGAITIGTLDGANVEIREQVGADNFFLFGLTVDQVCELKSAGYHPRQYYENNPELKQALDTIASGTYSGGDRHLFEPMIDSLLNDDPFLVLADYQAYVNCQERVSEAFADRERWIRMSIVNTANSGKFSSDRAVREYCEGIWNVVPVRVELS
jgi:starch phosphorylase